MASRNLLSKFWVCSCAVLVSAAFSATGWAQEIVIDASARGGYLLLVDGEDEFGFHDASNDSYLTGWDGDFESRSFFVFNIPVLPNATSATLTLWNPPFGFFSETPLNLRLGAISTSVENLTASHFFTAEGLAIFNDLGTGSEFGSIEVFTEDPEEGSSIVINLNASALAAINAAGGSQLAIAAVVTDLAKVPSESESVFQATTSAPAASAKLTINPVPEPTTAVLLGLSAGAVLIFRRRRMSR